MLDPLAHRRGHRRRDVDGDHLRATRGHGERERPHPRAEVDDRGLRAEGVAVEHVEVLGRVEPGFALVAGDVLLVEMLAAGIRELQQRPLFHARERARCPVAICHPCPIGSHLDRRWRRPSLRRRARRATCARQPAFDDGEARVIRRRFRIVLCAYTVRVGCAWVPTSTIHSVSSTSSTARSSDSRIRLIDALVLRERLRSGARSATGGVGSDRAATNHPARGEHPVGTENPER